MIHLLPGRNAAYFLHFMYSKALYVYSVHAGISIRNLSLGNSPAHPTLCGVGERCWYCAVWLDACFLSGWMSAFCLGGCLLPGWMLPLYNWIPVNLLLDVEYKDSLCILSTNLCQLCAVQVIALYLSKSLGVETGVCLVSCFGGKNLSICNSVYSRFMETWNPMNTWAFHVQNINLTHAVCHCGGKNLNSKDEEIDIGIITLHCFCIVYCNQLYSRITDFLYFALT